VLDFTKAVRLVVQPLHYYYFYKQPITAH
jgi:hypothetical protein